MEIERYDFKLRGCTYWRRRCCLLRHGWMDSGESTNLTT